MRALRVAHCFVRGSLRTLCPSTRVQVSTIFIDRYNLLPDMHHVCGLVAHQRLFVVLTLLCCMSNTAMPPP